ncbi:hypothetical protein JMG10_13365 [Nostoc ellipsosporum NOK]|nr:hypothetical protein [Nostoc ellipsosporum NOK]
MSITIAEIQEAVARHYGTDLLDMKSRRRAVRIVRPRQIAMYLANLLTPRTMPEIARLFGDCDHTTVLHAMRRIAAMRLEDEDMDFAIADLSRRITAQHQHKLNDELIGWIA